MIATVVMNKEATMNRSFSSSNNCSSFSHQTVPLLDASSVKSDAADEANTNSSSGSGKKSPAKSPPAVVLPYTRHALSLSTKVVEDAKERRAAALKETKTTATNTSAASATATFPKEFIPPPPAATLAAAEISMEQWNMFAAKVQPILKRLRYLDSCYNHALGCATGYILCETVNVAFPLCIIYPMVMLVTMLLFSNAIYEVIHQKFWKSFLQRSEAMLPPSSRGDNSPLGDAGDSGSKSIWTDIEYTCKDEWFDWCGTALGTFYLYFLEPPLEQDEYVVPSTPVPVAAATAEAANSSSISSSYNVHPTGCYLRFPISGRDQSVSAWWRPEQQPRVPCYHSLPAAFRHGLDEDLWSRFALDWQILSSNYMASQHHVTTYLRMCLVLWLVMLMQTLIEQPYPVWIHIVVPLAFVVTVGRLLVAKWRKIGLFEQCVQKAKAFNDATLFNQGLYLEHRCVAELGNYYGLREVRYLYLIRLPTATVNESTIAEL